jgi:hypothetical protein
MTLSKNCLVCGNLFNKTATQSVKTWNTSVKYCSKKCQIIGVAKVAGPRFAALNVSRTGQRKTYSQNWYKENRDRLSVEAKIKYQEHKQEVLIRRKERMKLETPEQRERRLTYLIEYRKSHQEKMRFNNQSLPSKFRQYSFAAKIRNYEFRLSFDEFKVLFNGFCAYCGDSNARGIDRIDNKVGYIKENSVSCCGMCNKMKWKWDKEKFLNHITKIYKFNN